MGRVDELHLRGFIPHAFGAVASLSVSHPWALSSPGAVITSPPYLYPPPPAFRGCLLAPAGPPFPSLPRATHGLFSQLTWVPPLAPPFCPPFIGPAMGGRTFRQPRLPKRSVIERLTATTTPCVVETTALLSALKASGFDDSRVASEMGALRACIAASATRGGARKTQKSSVFYHLKRLYYMQRR